MAEYYPPSLTLVRIREVGRQMPPKCRELQPYLPLPLAADLRRTLGIKLETLGAPHRICNSLDQYVENLVSANPGKC